MVKEKEKENKFGMMVPNMKDIGEMIWQMVEEDSYMPMEMSMKEIGKMIKLMLKVFTFIEMEYNYLKNIIKLLGFVSRRMV